MHERDALIDTLSPDPVALKRAAGRPRDFDAIAELEVLLEEQQRIESEGSTTQSG